MPIKCDFELASGEIPLKNIISYNFHIWREPGVNGHVADEGHQIDKITIVRHKSLEQGGAAQVEDEISKLAAELGDAAYFKGTLTLSRASNTANPIQKLHWDKGHICNLKYDVLDGGKVIHETIEVAVTELHVDNSTFNRPQTA